MIITYLIIQIWHAKIQGDLAVNVNISQVGGWAQNNASISYIFPTAFVAEFTYNAVNPVLKKTNHAFWVGSIFFSIYHVNELKSDFWRWGRCHSAAIMKIRAS